MNTTPLIPAGYADWLAAIKKEIAQARSRAALAVNAELVQLYHRLGGEIQQRQEAHGARVDRARIVLGLDGLALADEEHRFLVDRLAQARVERTMWREQVRERSRQAARSRRGQDRGDSAKAGGRRRGRRRPR